jgi:N-acetylglutamate synthase-like GNAT family acetyltransferase
MKLFVRAADIKDSEYITKLSNQLGYETTNEKIQKRLADISNNDDNCIFVIVDNENIIGWIHGFHSLRVESDSFIEIGGLVVDENYRRKGLGKMLIKKIIEWSHFKKSNKIKVRCNTLRKETHAFYNNIGFIEIKEQKIFDMKLD